MSEVEVTNLRDALDRIVDDVQSIESILGGGDGDGVCRTGEARPATPSIEERIESLRISMESLHGRLVEIRKRAQQISREI